MFIRKKIIHERVYYYLVESKRHGLNVRQHIIRYLGKTPPDLLTFVKNEEIYKKLKVEENFTQPKKADPTTKTTPIL
jgi:hypothetical protein